MSRRARPRVIVTGPARGGRFAWRLTALALYAAGGSPRRVTPRSSLPSHYDAIVLGGGADIAPARFAGDPRDAHPGRLDLERDQLELDLVADACARDIAVLGICRGAQLLNVHAGGTVLMNANPSPAPHTARAIKLVEARRGSLLASVLGRDRCRINSMHRNAIGALGDGLVVSGRDVTNLVQAIEAPARRFCLGVQWHPEFLLARRPQRRLFHALVAAA